MHYFSLLFFFFKYLCNVYNVELQVKVVVLLKYVPPLLEMEPYFSLLCILLAIS